MNYLYADMRTNARIIFEIILRISSIDIICIKTYILRMIKQKITPMLRLKQYIKDSGTQRQAALMLKISPQYLCDMVKKRRPISHGVMDAMGLKVITTYTEDK